MLTLLKGHRRFLYYSSKPFSSLGGGEQENKGYCNACAYVALRPSAFNKKIFHKCVSVTGVCVDVRVGGGAGGGGEVVNKDLFCYRKR